MSDNLRNILMSESSKDEKKSKSGEGKMLKKLHMLDDTIDNYIEDLEDKIMNVEENPTFVRKATQLLANLSKEYSEFISALRAVVHAVDRKGKVIPTFEKQESKVRSVLDNIDGEGGEEEIPKE